MLAWLDKIVFQLKWPWPLVLIVLAMTGAAVLAYSKKHLSLSGAVAAIIEGTVVLWCVRFEGFFLFFVFYFTSTILGKYCRYRAGVFKPHEPREVLSVLANGCMATIAALHFYNTGYFGALLMFGTSIAEAASDTWAGEVGRLSVKPPVSIRNLQEVKKGLSGGVTPLGFIVGFAAVVFIALLWIFCFRIPNRGVGFTIICFAGFGGCVLDSFLGATCQALYEDANTLELTESEVSSDGKPNKLVRGFAWMDNDAVNFISNFISAIFALAMSAFIY